jgi:hypothetical protein
VAEHLETFTIDAKRSDVRELCVKYLTGFQYRLTQDEGQTLLFEKGTKRSNLFTFSFEKAYKSVAVSIVGNDRVPVTTVSMTFTLPYHGLRKEEVQAIRSMTEALKEFILITVGYVAN